MRVLTAQDAQPMGRSILKRPNAKGPERIFIPGPVFAKNSVQQRGLFYPQLQALKAIDALTPQCGTCGVTPPHAMQTASSNAAQSEKP